MPLPLPPGVLRRIGEGLPAARELGRFATAPRYEAFFKGGAAAQIARHGGLSPVQREGSRITEVNRLRRVRFSPAEFANLAFGLASFVVGQEHLARIDRQLAGLRERVDEMAAMLEDGMAAPVLDVLASMHRFGPDGAEGLPPSVVEAWWRDLRRTRLLLIPKIERLATQWSAIRPTASWTWGGVLEDLAKGDRLTVEAGRLLDLLGACDAMLTRIALSTGTGAALDGVDGATPGRLGAALAAAADPVILAANERAGTDFDRLADVRRVVGGRHVEFKRGLAGMAEQEALRVLALGLRDGTREFRITFEHGEPTALAEVVRPVPA